MNLLCWTKWLLNFEEDQYPYLDFCDTRINQGLFINTYTSTLLLKIMHCARSPKLRPRPNVSGYFLKRIFFVRRFSLLFDSHINGILGHQTLLKSFQKRSPDYMWTDENGVFRIRRCHKVYTTNTTHAL